VILPEKSNKNTCRCRQVFLYNFCLQYLHFQSFFNFKQAAELRCCILQEEDTDMASGEL
jgi:hypothetical protein